MKLCQHNYFFLNKTRWRSWQNLHSKPTARLGVAWPSVNRQRSPSSASNIRCRRAKSFHVILGSAITTSWVRHLLKVWALARVWELQHCIVFKRLEDYKPLKGGSLFYVLYEITVMSGKIRLHSLVLIKTIFCSTAKIIFVFPFYYPRQKGAVEKSNSISGGNSKDKVGSGRGGHPKVSPTLDKLLRNITSSSPVFLWVKNDSCWKICLLLLIINLFPFLYEWLDG